MGTIHARAVNGRWPSPLSSQSMKYGRRKISTAEDYEEEIRQFLTKDLKISSFASTSPPRTRGP